MESFDAAAEAGLSKDMCTSKPTESADTNGRRLFTLWTLTYYLQLAGRSNYSLIITVADSVVWCHSNIVSQKIRLEFRLLHGQIIGVPCCFIFLHHRSCSSNETNIKDMQTVRASACHAPWSCHPDISLQVKLDLPRESRTWVTWEGIKIKSNSGEHGKVEQGDNRVPTRCCIFPRKRQVLSFW